MVKGYFAASWDDLKHSPNWGTKLLKLSLLTLIPIFGVVVLFGYLFGWAREIAWNIHRPLADKIFNNEDKNFYRRGLFVLVVVLVFGLVPYLFSVLTNVASGCFFPGTVKGNSPVAFSRSFFSNIAFLVWGAVAFFASMFIYVGSMRSSIYSTLSSGFQLSKIWSMIRYDFRGLLKIFGMNLLIGLIAFVAILVFLALVSFVGFSFDSMLVKKSTAPIIIMSVFIAILGLWFCSFAFVFEWTLVSRALGYWMRQFDVSSWGGQDDPMPFEKQGFYNPNNPPVNHSANMQDSSQAYSGGVNAQSSAQQSSTQGVPTQFSTPNVTTQTFVQEVPGQSINQEAVSHSVNQEVAMPSNSEVKVSASSQEASVQPSNTNAVAQASNQETCAQSVYQEVITQSFGHEANSQVSNQETANDGSIPSDSSENK